MHRESKIIKKWPFLVVTILVLFSLVFVGCVSNSGSKSGKKEYSLTMAVSGKGTTLPSVGTHTFKEGASFQILATAAHGWKFDSWSGDVSGNFRSIILHMDGNKSITANFSAMTYILTMAVNGNGTTDPPAGEHAYSAGTVVNITATPTSGWKFNHWSGFPANASSPNTTVTMNTNKTITANFSIAPR